jgi:glutaminase
VASRALTDARLSIEPPSAFVSTGELPPPERVRMLMDDAHARFASVDDGRPSQTYPALARASPELFGICVVEARGGVYGVGDDEVEFTIMSVAKPFVLALICPLWARRK